MISILLPWFLIAAAVLLVLYALTSAFYRASARDLKVRTLPMNPRFFLKIPAATGFYLGIVSIFPILGDPVGDFHHSCLRGRNPLH